MVIIIGIKGNNKADNAWLVKHCKDFAFHINKIETLLS